MITLTDEARATEAVHAISQFTNCMGYRSEAFVEAMSREHRTLQQSFTRACLEWLYHLSQLQEGYYDLRNEASVKIAKEFFKDKDQYACCLPLI